MGARRQCELRPSKRKRFNITREVDVLLAVTLGRQCRELVAVLLALGSIPESRVAAGKQVVGSRRRLTRRNRLLQIRDGLLVLSHLGEDTPQAVIGGR